MRRKVDKKKRWAWEWTGVVIFSELIRVIFEKKKPIHNYLELLYVIIYKNKKD